ncbi:helix-turn-helix domain-containing protein [Luteibacter yeojuensis]|uniref:helix-turn-helix domain-containing protein n=1 Tax=Luteibacter yeojuensis TaxID=345309 RepID=UPI0012EDF668|nr:AraC family transcriptional regulator [Luteibacter yeojuensis]
MQIAQQALHPELPAGTAILAAARACGISRVHFSRMFKASMGMSPRRWHLQRRVLHAQRLLETTSASLTDIASQCGFCDQSHFTRVFRRVCHAPPGMWRKAASERLFPTHLEETA